MQERSLTEDEKAEFKERAEQATQNLGLTGPEIAPERVVEAVNTFVDNWQTERRSAFQRLLAKRGPDAVDVALGLGAVWGDALVTKFGWEWTCLLQNGQEFYAVASADRSLVIYPTYYLKACLDEPKADCTALLAFNMLAAGKISGPPPNGYENLMAGVHRIVPK